MGNFFSNAVASCFRGSRASGQRPDEAERSRWVRGEASRVLDVARSGGVFRRPGMWTDEFSDKGLGKAVKRRDGTCF